MSMKTPLSSRRQYQHHKKPAKSLFWAKILDNKFMISIISLFLVVLTIYLITQIGFLFEPVGIALSIIAPPFILAFLFYYLLKPVVNWLTNHKMPRGGAIALVFIVILLLIIWAFYYVIPLIQSQIQTFLQNIPIYINAISNQLDEFLRTDAVSDALKDLQSMNIISRVSESASNVFSLTIDSIGNFFGVLATIVITIITAPFVLYYLLADGENFKNGFLKVVPTQWRPQVDKFLYEADRQVGSYVRGQLLVAVGVAIIFYIGYSLINLDYALLLSVAAGILNMVPYLGSIASAIPALIIGAFVSPMKFVQVALVLIIEQTIEGRLLSPLILGNTMEIHPLMILFILLIAGGIFGVAGVLLAVPAYAILRIIVVMTFDWVKENTDWYQEPSPKRDQSSM